MEWISLQHEQQLQEIKEKSKTRTQVIFKHSIRCGVSSVVKSRLDKGKLPTDNDYYFLDIIHYRALSNKIAEEFTVYHESPQVLVIRNGECVYDESHMGITVQDILLQTM
ncbi:MAG: bacillithiol system redox-active protein YtxJ [Chitinophagaceae bacterium]|nr:bacillithiol system redox-active protein YtxJ [Chitinophagaceae bacterium]